MPVVVRRPAPPLDGLITAITYRAGEQPRTSVEKILPGPETGHGYADQPHLADEFRELADITPAQYLRCRMDGPNHLRFPPGER
jgi:hypothetical protein